MGVRTWGTATLQLFVPWQLWQGVESTSGQYSVPLVCLLHGPLPPTLAPAWCGAQGTISIVGLPLPAYAPHPLALCGYPLALAAWAERANVQYASVSTES